MVQSAIALRRELHRNPELSGREYQTAATIKNYLEHLESKVISGIGGHGVAGIWEYGAGGRTVVIRCELDALPIEESNRFEHRSAVPGVSHKCGHDGHMAIVAGLLPRLKELNFKKGRVVLLFQPAEENGEGAHAVTSDQRFKDLNVDFVFALHNLPGYPLHEVITTPDYFSATVQSLVVRLHGKQSHASEPEKGINPAVAVAEIINAFAVRSIADVHEKQFALVTPVHIHLGQKAYGISAGEAEVHYTLRTWSESVMEELKKQLTGIVADISQRHGLNFDREWLDYFPASANAHENNTMIKNAARYLGLTIRDLPHPFKFGEDFGWYSKEYRCAMFGLGGGENSPALHHADYDFPDEIIGTGIEMFLSIVNQILVEDPYSTRQLR